MPTIITPPLLLDSSGVPANGTIFARATSPFIYGGDYVTTAGGYGVVRDGVFRRRGNGGDFFLPPTPPAVAFELVLILEEDYNGRTQKKTTTRTVTVPDTATATWVELIDTVADTPAADFIIPPWIAALMADLDTALSATDALVASNVGNPVSATAIALAKTPANNFERTAVLFGDSIEYYNFGDPTHPTRPSPGSRGYATQANAFLGHRLSFINKGVGGEDTLAMLTRMTADLVNVTASWAFIGAGTNDISNARTFNQITQNLATLYAAAAASGKRVVGRTIPPRTGQSVGDKALRSQVNQWIRGQAYTRKGFIVNDMERAVMDPTTNDFVTGYSYDGVHLASPGAIAAGTSLADTLRPFLPVVPVVIAAADPRNLLASLGGGFPGAAAVLPTGWTANGWSQGAPTYSKVARTDKPGQWQQILVPTDSRGFLRSTVLLMSGGLFAVGDTVQAAVEFDVSALEVAPTAATQALYMGIEYYDGTTTTYRYDLEYHATDNENQGNRSRSGVMVTPPFTIPAGGSAQSLAMTIQARCGGTYKFADASLFKV